MRKRFVTRFNVVREIDRVNDEYLAHIKLNLWSRDAEDALEFDDEDEAYEAAIMNDARVEKFKCLRDYEATFSDASRTMNNERRVYSALAAE